MLTKHLGTNDATCAGSYRPRWACASKRPQGIGFVLSAVAIDDRVAKKEPGPGEGLSSRDGILRP